MPANTITIDLSGPIADYPDLAARITRNFLDGMYMVLVGTALPRMRNAIPVRTGNLRNQIGIHLLANEREITVNFTRRGFYWHFQSGLGERLEEIFRDVVNSNAQGVLNQAVSKALAGG